MALYRWWSGLLDIMFIQYAHVRASLFWYVVGTILFPLGVAFFMRSFALGGPDRAPYVLAGSFVMALIFGSLNLVSGQLGWAKDEDELDYYVTLPVSSLQLLLGLVLVSIVAALPGSLIMLTLAAALVGVSLAPIWWWLLPAALLSAAAIAAVGLVIGVWSTSGQHANVLANIATMLLVFVAPVHVPAEMLPGAMQTMRRFFPTGYAQDVLYTALTGQITPATWLSAAVLLGFTVLGFTLAIHRLNQR